jgi:hypothetical protein
MNRIFLLIRMAWLQAGKAQSQNQNPDNFPQMLQFPSLLVIVAYSSGF